MCRIDVQPGSLAQLGTTLRRAADVADDVSRFGSGTSARCAGQGCGPVVEDALLDFLGGWAHGSTALGRDARTLAELLVRAGTVYVDVEAEIAGLLR